MSMCLSTGVCFSELAPHNPARSFLLSPGDRLVKTWGRSVALPQPARAHWHTRHFKLHSANKKNWGRVHVEIYQYFLS